MLPVCWLPMKQPSERLLMFHQQRTTVPRVEVFSTELEAQGNGIKCREVRGVCACGANQRDSYHPQNILLYLLVAP